MSIAWLYNLQDVTISSNQNITRHQNKSLNTIDKPMKPQINHDHQMTTNFMCLSFLFLCSCLLLLLMSSFCCGLAFGWWRATCEVHSWHVWNTYFCCSSSLESGSCITNVDAGASSWKVAWSFGASSEAGGSRMEIFCPYKFMHWLWAYVPKPRICEMHTKIAVSEL